MPILDKEMEMKRNILLTRIAEALEKQNELKQKELEFIQYQSEIMLNEYELELKKDTIAKEEEQRWQSS